MKAANALSIGALSKHSGVNIETIRYYEKIGVMPTPDRSASGYRLYGPDHLKRLSFVRRGRQLGFSLDEIRGLLRLVDGDTYTCAQVRELTLDHVAEIRRKIADLKRLKRVMEEMAAQCSGGRAPECAIIDALFDVRQLLAKDNTRLRTR
ncbi:helix-turn-helix domain-containing protein [Methylocystis sp.]|jgi:MerR family mercuric resistance operon transcriptional regulator|uniref:MerR family transcriptional regulator n=1 Tax=Methylocystis sp. TaxID=1911079 RepID=UPI0025DD23C1|nr:helix-turn-helix domain-containing protein [Methylocystis sp.]